MRRRCAPRISIGLGSARVSAESSLGRYKILTVATTSPSRCLGAIAAAHKTRLHPMRRRCSNKEKQMKRATGVSVLACGSRRELRSTSLTIAP